MKNAMLNSAYAPYTVAAPEPSAMSESMLGARFAKARKPTRKNLKLMKMTGTSSTNRVSPYTIMFSIPVSTLGNGQPNMSPIEM
ncbi:unknown [Eggerthella sp. CAG:209]|nr:unknown [Eggerthella sp. CAG:209]